MNAAILFAIDGSWMLVEEDRLRRVPEYPRLAAPTLVLTDFDGAVSGVSTIHEKKPYAEALIGRRLRDDRTIGNEENKVLIHHGAPVPEGWQALYTAMPMAVWRRAQSWAASLPEHCLLIPRVALMRRLIRRDGEGVVFHTGKGISVLARAQGRIHYFSAQVRGDTEEDLRACAVTLAGRIRQELAPGASGPGFVLRWHAFGEASVAEIFARHAACRVEEVDREAYLQEDGASRRLPLKAISSCLSERIAASPPLARASYFAERNIGYFSLCAGALAVVVLLAAVAFFFQAEAIHASAEAMRAETQKIAAAAGLASGQAAGSLPADFPATRDFIDLLSAAKTETIPGDLLHDLRLASDENVRLLRIHMQPDDRLIVIEGWIDAASGGDRQLAGFLTRMRRLGFAPEAVDASLAPRARPGSAFAYRLHPGSRAKGEVQ
jgi:hypothetical protein